MIIYTSVTARYILGITYGSPSYVATVCPLSAIATKDGFPKTMCETCLGVADANMFSTLYLATNKQFLLSKNIKFIVNFNA